MCSTHPCIASALERLLNSSPQAPMSTSVVLDQVPPRLPAFADYLRVRPELHISPRHLERAQRRRDPRSGGATSW
eukprot:6823300-Pyramimonas_sp.AAC.1